MLEHSSVRLEVLEEDGQEEEDAHLLTYDINFSFQEAALLELEHHNEEACTHLASYGYNSQLLLTKFKRRPKILERISENAGEAAKVRALADSDLKLPAIHQTVGPTCISGDEILKSNLQLLLCWKLTENEYKVYKVADKNTSKEELRTLWNEFRDHVVPDIELPPEDEEEI